MFRVIKESEYVDERQHCFLLQTVGRESRYFSMETRQELLRLESAWHRAVCQAVSTLEVSLKSTKGSTFGGGGNHLLSLCEKKTYLLLKVQDIISSNSHFTLGHFIFPLF